MEALGPLQAAVEAVRGATLAPVAIPAQSALAVASLAVMGHADVETLGGPRPTALYALTIAKSGERKTASDTLLMAALREFEREQAKAHGLDMERWRNGQAIWKSRRDAIVAEAKKGKGKGDKRDMAEADLVALGPEPAAPASPDRTVTEPTFEGLTRLFAHGQPALGIFSDEGGQFLGGFAMSPDNRQKTLAALNDLWQGNPIRRTRQGEGAYTLYGRRLAVHLMVQPGVARDFHGRPEDGRYRLPAALPDLRAPEHHRDAAPGDGAAGQRGARQPSPAGCAPSSKRRFHQILRLRELSPRTSPSARTRGRCWGASRTPSRPSKRPEAASRT